LSGLGLATGYCVAEALMPVIQITAVTHRAGPVLPSIVPASPPNEETWLRRAVEIRDAMILAMIAQFRDLRPVLRRPGIQALLREIDWMVPNAQ